ncbi:MAG: hypothetical protein ACPHRO_15920 [Nannocystaceae bacterium]
MKHIPTIALSLSLVSTMACSPSAEPAKDAKNTDATPTAAKAEDSAKAAKAPPAAEAPKPDPVALAAEARKNGPGGLPVGKRFSAFQIINASTGEEYCQVCRFGSSPKIMATGTVDDPGFREDLKNIDALVAKHGPDKLKAFAVIAEVDGDHLVTPKASREDLLAKAKALTAELELTYPVVLPAPEGEGRNTVFEDHYNVKTSRTLMFADSGNLVQYNEVAPSDLASLDKAITTAIGG